MGLIMAITSWSAVGVGVTVGAPSIVEAITVTSDDGAVEHPVIGREYPPAR